MSLLEKLYEDIKTLIVKTFHLLKMKSPVIAAIMSTLLVFIGGNYQQIATDFNITSPFVLAMVKWGTLVLLALTGLHTTKSMEKIRRKSTQS
jgi:hypothetical protein